MLDVKRMKVLREVASRGSFSAAAEALSFTQSAVSQQVAALEREVGTTLLERGPRGVRLTDAGRTLVSHTDAILARIECAEDELAALAGLRGGRLRLACFQSAGATLVPRAVAQFHDRHPDVELSMVEAEPEDAQERLRAGDIDLALVYDFEPVPDTLGKDLELTHLIDDCYDAVLSARTTSSPSRRRLKLADLSDEPWIASTDACGCRQLTERACLDAGFAPNVAFEADETMAAQALVAAGVGVTIFPRLALNPLHPGVVARSLGRDAPVRRIWAARLREGYTLRRQRGDAPDPGRRGRGVPRAAGPGGRFLASRLGRRRTADVEALGVVHAHFGEQRRASRPIRRPRRSSRCRSCARRRRSRSPPAGRRRRRVSSRTKSMSILMKLTGRCLR